MFWTVHILFYLCYEISKRYIYLGTLISYREINAESKKEQAPFPLSSHEYV